MLDETLEGTSLDETFDQFQEMIGSMEGRKRHFIGLQKLSSLDIAELNNIYRVSNKADDQVLKVSNVEQLGLDGSVSFSGSAPTISFFQKQMMYYWIILR